MDPHRSWTLGTVWDQPVLIIQPVIGTDGDTDGGQRPGLRWHRKFSAELCPLLAV